MRSLQTEGVLQGVGIWQTWAMRMFNACIGALNLPQHSPSTVAEQIG